jgi:hypothetical protein
MVTAAMHCASEPTQAQMGTVTLENWLYYQENYGASARWQYQPRLLMPFAFGGGWTFTQRIDVPFYYTNATGSANADGAWRFRTSDVFVEEIFDTPDIARNFSVRASVRLVAPTGGAAPFGSDQWQVAPGAGFTWKLPEALRGVTAAPFARYSFGFDPRSADIATIRKINLLPKVTFGLIEDWAVAVYPQQGIWYDVRTRQWFVPAEAMVAKRKGQIEYAIGGAYAIVDDYPLYRWLIEARLTYSF